MAIGADSSGSIYVVGSASVPFKSGSRAHWIARKSTDGGNSWTTVDGYQLEADNSSQARAFVTDANGNLFVAGQGNQGVYGGTSSPEHWVVRKSADRGSSWTTVDVFQYGDYSTVPNAIAADPFGRVFVGGSAVGHWLIKRY